MRLTTLAFIVVCASVLTIVTADLAQNGQWIQLALFGGLCGIFGALADRAYHE